MKTITIAQLKSVNNDLATRISQLAELLKEENPNIKSSFWVNVEVLDSRVYILADNGYDISESIEVINGDKEKILALI